MTGDKVLVINSSESSALLGGEGDKQQVAPRWWEKLNPLPHGSMAASGFNLASATLGAGTLALPSAFEAAGTAFSAIFLIVCAVATVYSIRLLVIVLDRTGHATYEQMSRHLIHKRMDYVTEFLIVMFCWGITVVYVVMIGDILDKLKDIHGFPTVFAGDWGQRLLTSIFWLVFMLPLSLAKEINTLRYASMAGIIATFVLMSAVVAHASENPNNYGKEMKYIKLDFNMVQAMPVILFSYCCQTNAFEIYSELNNRNVKRMTWSAGVSMAVCTMIYIVTGTAGYVDFGNFVHGNILKNYHPVGTPYLAVAFFSISITLTMAFPICIFPTRDAILQLFGYQDVYHTPAKVRLLVAGVLATGSLAVGLFTPGVRVLFDLLGGVCGSMISFILPAWFAFKSGPWTPSTVGWPDVIGTWLLLISGIIIGLLGTAISIYQMVNPQG